MCLYFENKSMQMTEAIERRRRHLQLALAYVDLTSQRTTAVREAACSIFWVLTFSNFSSTQGRFGCQELQRHLFKRVSLSPLLTVRCSTLRSQIGYHFRQSGVKTNNSLK